MPTVKTKNMTRVFPYNAVGKAQADSFAKMMKGKISYMIAEETAGNLASSLNIAELTLTVDLLSKDNWKET